jgi:hypothetical protein
MGREGVRVRPGGAAFIWGGGGRAASGLYGPTDRATFGLQAEEAAHGPPGHRTGPPVARKVRIGPAQVPGRFYGPWAGPRIAGHMANYNHGIGK